jgi:hypothetical protein
MLLSREEMRFDFGGAKLDPVRDKAVLGWIMSQFLYGEVTGIQIGHWLYDAPDIEAARFLSRQAVEEFQHVGNFVEILGILGESAQPAHPVVRYLATGAMPSSWAEHVALEMAIGEGLVLQCFYAMIETVDEPRIVAILERGVRQEERHVAFGEERTMSLAREAPEVRALLLGQALVSIAAVRRLEQFMQRRMPMTHPVLSQLPAFVAHSIAKTELRLERMGLTDEPLASIGGGRRASIIARSFAQKALGAISSAPRSSLERLGMGRVRRLTETYLSDPAITGTPRNGAPSSVPRAS